MKINARYNTHTLPNGLRIIHLPQDSEVVYCGYAINAGARDEAPEEEGLAHFCEHMTFKGTARLTPIQIINSLELVGGELNAFTAKEETVYYASVLSQHFSKAVELLTEIVFHSVYPQHEINKEIDVVCDEIESYRDSPAELIYDEFENEILCGSSLGHNVLGTRESVKSFNTADCARFTKRLYLPSNSVFYVSGNISFASLIKRLEKLFADTEMAVLPTREALPTVTIAQKRKDMMEMQTHQTHVMIGTAITEDIERWRYPLFLTNNLLGGPSMNSRLNLSLREKHGLVYTVEGIMTSYTDALLWTVYYGCDGRDTDKCLRLIRKQLNILRSKPLSARALAAAKRQIKGQIALASENRESYAIDMAKQYLHRGTLKDNFRLYNNIDNITSEDIHALATEVLNDSRLFTLTYC